MCLSEFQRSLWWILDIYSVCGKHCWQAVGIKVRTGTAFQQSLPCFVVSRNSFPAASPLSFPATEIMSPLWCVLLFSEKSCRSTGGLVFLLRLSANREELLLVDSSLHLLRIWCRVFAFHMLTKQYFMICYLKSENRKCTSWGFA